LLYITAAPEGSSIISNRWEQIYTLTNGTDSSLNEIQKNLWCCGFEDQAHMPVMGCGTNFGEITILIDNDYYVKTD
jgi:hypothetical protein